MANQLLSVLSGPLSNSKDRVNLETLPVGVTVEAICLNGKKYWVRRSKNDCAEDERALRLEVETNEIWLPACPGYDSYGQSAITVGECWRFGYYHQTPKIVEIRFVEA